ncbi:MAG TPA: O-antigen ligase family protein [Bacteroidia bacterium]|nr:O-antigen ligase family protein [Bacteroidia bacterium]
MAASLSLGKFFVGGSLFILGFNWVFEGNFKAKFRLFRARKAIPVLMGLFLLHLIGTMWSADPAAAWLDVKIKLPLLIIPLVIGTTDPLEKKFFEAILLVFTLAVFISSFTTIGVMHGFIHTKKTINDYRDASIFVPLIRLSLMSVLSIFLFARWFVRNKNIIVRLCCIAGTAWFVWFMQHMQSLTGIVILFAGGALLLLLMAFLYNRKKLAYALIVLYAGAGIGAYAMMHKVYKENFTYVPATFKTLDEYTALGNKYDHRLNWPMVENGNEVMINICWKEIDSCWKLRSKFDIDTARDHKGYWLSITLFRYMTSKGLRKDAAGLAQLTDAEIHDVENGVTNYKDKTRSPMEKRLYQVCWEYFHYSHGTNPSGNSVSMRVELAKTAWSTMKKHPWVGVGTGGQELAYKELYNTEGSKLEKEFWWLHSHNQFLSIGVCLGFPGLLYFIFMLYYAPFSMKRWKSFLYVAFFIIVAMSMFDDDTLETQQGVNFFAFFNAILLFAMPRQSAINTSYNVGTSASPED